MQLVNLITFTGLFLSICIIVSLSYKVHLLRTALGQSVLDNKVVSSIADTLRDQLNIVKDETEETQEHFIKFLSDSRLHLTILKNQLFLLMKLFYIVNNK